MRTINENLATLKQAEEMIGVSRGTMYHWYKWWNNPNFKKPEGLELPTLHLMGRQTQVLDKKDVPMLKKFHEQLQTTHRGAMSEYNAVVRWTKKKGMSSIKNKGGDFVESYAKRYSNYVKQED